MTDCPKVLRRASFPMSRINYLKCFVDHVIFNNLSNQTFFEKFSIACPVSSFFRPLIDQESKQNFRMKLLFRFLVLFVQLK